jgi:exosortase
VTQINSFSKQKITAVVLSGELDFGRCPLASRLPVALWPVAGKNALERLLLSLVGQGIEKVKISCGQNKSLLSESTNIDKHIQIKYMDEPLPAGTAGSIREAAEDKDSLLILFPSSLVCPPNIDALISEHQKSKSDLSVVLEQDYPGTNGSSEKASGIYICNASVLEFIPEDGYCDIKEGLIPQMLRAGKSVNSIKLSHGIGNFRDCHEYLQAVSDNIERVVKQNNLKPEKIGNSCTIWKGTGVQVDPSATVSGDVVLMDGVEISEGAIITGPSVLEKNVIVSKNSVIVNSILWDNSIVGADCIVESCVLDYNSYLHTRTSCAERCIVFERRKVTESFDRSILKITKNKLEALKHISVKIKQIFPEATKVKTQKTIKYVAPAAIIIAFMWSYWPGLISLWKVWMQSDEYSSGLLVPFLAIYILWLRRQAISQVPVKPSIWGLFLFLFAQAFRIFGLFFLFSSVEMFSIVLSIAGIVLFLFGCRLFIKISTVLLFLFLMLPWPHRVQAAVSLPLQSLSTSSAVFCLQVMGFDIMREGNIIHIGNSTVAVAEACNGLRMITAFFVISGLVALLINRTWWEKLIVLISSLPVAFLCNTLRLAITAIFFTIIEGPYWEKVFHDFGGYAMMPLAVAFIVAELWFVDKLTVPPEEKKEIIILRQKK